MIALVTGASGFIGRHLVEKLLAHGHEVRGLVRDPARMGGLEHPRLTLHSGDLTRPESVAAAARGVDAIFHLAAALRARSDSDYDAVNARGTRAVVDALKAAAAAGPNRAPRLIYVSSLAAAGPADQGRPLKADDPPRPISMYGRTKLAGETIIRQEVGDLPWTVVRPPVVYGPRDKDVFLLFKMARRGVLPIIGDGRQPMPMIHVTDLVEAIALAGEKADSGTIWYATDGDIHDNAGIMEALARAMGVAKPKRVHVPIWFIALAGNVGQLIYDVTGRPMVINRDKVREIKAPSWACDDEPIRRLGYRPTLNLAAGLADTVRWYRENGWL